MSDSAVSSWLGRFGKRPTVGKRPAGTPLVESRSGPSPQSAAVNLSA